MSLFSVAYSKCKVSFVQKPGTVKIYLYPIEGDNGPTRSMLFVEIFDSLGWLKEICDDGLDGTFHFHTLAIVAFAYIQ